MSPASLQDKVALVTGGASGIGRATAQRMVEAGASVVVTDLDGDGAATVAEELGDRARWATLDVTDADASAEAVAVAEREFGHLDILSCNAGFTGYPAPAMEADADEFRRIFEINVFGVWLGVRAAVPALRRGQGGAITIVGSVMGERTRPGFGAYASSKAATNHLARTLALELAPDIRVNCLAPVATDTAMLPSFLGPDDPEGAKQRFIESIPLSRLGQATDVADAAVYLSSDAASFLTGVVLPVDGGRSI